MSDEAAIYVPIKAVLDEDSLEVIRATIREEIAKALEGMV